MPQSSAEQAQPMQSAEIPTTITIQQAGRLIGLSRSAAYRAANRGQIPSMKSGRRWFVPVRPLADMLGLELAEAMALIDFDEPTGDAT